MKKYITNSLFVVTPLASAAGINAATTGGFAFSFIAKAVMGLAMGATAQFALAGAASAALIMIVAAAIYFIYDKVKDPDAVKVNDDQSHSSELIGSELIGSDNDEELEQATPTPQTLQS